MIKYSYKPNDLPAPLYETVDGIMLANSLHIDSGTLFWSVARLFGYYERSMQSLESSQHHLDLLDADIESFIIRLRIILNDISYMVRQLIPAHARGVANPKGSTHPKNREMSLTELYKSLDKYQKDYPEFWAIFRDLQPWTDALRNDRDNLIHYKSRVLIIDNRDGKFFCINNAAGSEPYDISGIRLKQQKVDTYLNSQLVQLHTLMHDMLPQAIRAFAERTGLETKPYGNFQRVSGPGIARFRIANNIHF